jgi:glycosyltransferase involved in cell wall biosynthesis
VIANNEKRTAHGMEEARIAVNQPLVSICTPSYNSAAFIRETVQGVLSQTYQNWEYIINDDCSSDDTVEIIRSYNDSRIRVYQNERNLGYGENVKRLARYASGAFVKMLDHDDVLYSDCVKRQTEVLVNNADITMVTCDADYINAAGKKVYVHKVPFKTDTASRKEVLDCMFRTGRNSFIDGSRVLMRKETLDAGFIMSADSRLFIIHEPLCAYRVLPDSLQMRLSCIKDFQRGYKSLYLNKDLHISRLQYINVCAVNFINYFARAALKILFNI